MAFDTSETLTQSTCGDELLPGTSLFHGQYRITRFINSGGFGITYLAKDSLNRDVVIKECFASAFFRRSESRVRARSQGTRDQMQRIVKSFLNEARSLAGLKHPNIVGVHQVFEDNDTAYMALDYIRGNDLQDMIDAGRTGLAPDQIVAMTGKLVAALGYIHGNGLLHCDISPDNIFINHVGEPILIDFGAARQSASGEAQKYSGLSVVKDGYSPHELYATGGISGPFSDIYALGASLYHAITGESPENCQSRLAARAEKRDDPCKPLAGRVAGYPAGFLESIDRAMAVLPAARFQSAADWAQALPQTAQRTDRKVVLLRRMPLQPAATAPEAPVSRPTTAPTAAVEAAPAKPAPRRPITRVLHTDISGVRRISGFTGGWLVNCDSGLVMAGEGAPDATDQQGTMATAIDLARANVRALSAHATGEGLDDVMIALGRRMHIIRPLDSAPKVCLCVALDAEHANPLLARMQLRRVAQGLRV